MKVLIACEFSGIVRDAFKKLGHDAWSCDLLETERKGNHIQGDVLDCVHGGWDIMIAHPPCTHICSSGARWWKNKKEQIELSLEFVKKLMDAPIWKICIENPVGLIGTRIRKPDQIIQPYMFGHPEMKRTCLWLKNLPLLTPTNVVSGRNQTLYHLPPTNDRWKIRSRTFQGIADAFAEQWGK